MVVINTAHWEKIKVLDMVGTYIDNDNDTFNDKTFKIPIVIFWWLVNRLRAIDYKSIMETSLGNKKGLIER